VSFDPSHLEVTAHNVSDAAKRLGDCTLIAAVKDAKGEAHVFGDKRNR
jgi:hypothetical protein